MIVAPEHFAFDRDKQRELETLATDEALTQEQRDSVNELGRDQPFFTEAKSYCFYCAQKLTVPAIMWHGNDGKHSGNTIEIWLHPKCAEQLSPRIDRDVNELKIGKKLANEQFATWKRDHPI